eukprot:g34936.t1
MPVFFGKGKSTREGHAKSDGDLAKASKFKDTRNVNSECNIDSSPSPTSQGRLSNAPLSYFVSPQAVQAWLKPLPKLDIDPNYIDHDAESSPRLPVRFRSAPEVITHKEEAVLQQPAQKRQRPQRHSADNIQVPSSFPSQSVNARLPHHADMQLPHCASLPLNLQLPPSPSSSSSSFSSSSSSATTTTLGNQSPTATRKRAASTQDNSTEPWPSGLASDHTFPDSVPPSPTYSTADPSHLSTLSTDFGTISSRTTAVSLPSARSTLVVATITPKARSNTMEQPNPTTMSTFRAVARNTITLGLPQEDYEAIPPMPVQRKAETKTRRSIGMFPRVSQPRYSRLSVVSLRNSLVSLSPVFKIQGGQTRPSVSAAWNDKSLDAFKDMPPLLPLEEKRDISPFPSPLRSSVVENMNKHSQASASPSPSNSPKTALSSSSPSSRARRQLDREKQNVQLSPTRSQRSTAIPGGMPNLSITSVSDPADVGDRFLDPEGIFEAEEQEDHVADEALSSSQRQAAASRAHQKKKTTRTATVTRSPRAETVTPRSDLSLSTSWTAASPKSISRERSVSVQSVSAEPADLVWEEGEAYVF